MTRMQIYEFADLPFTPVDSSAFLKNVPEQEIRNRYRAVLKAEAPIDEWTLIDRVLNSFDIRKAGSSIRPVMQAILDSMELKKSEDGGTVYWGSIRESGYTGFRLPRSNDERRDVTHVPVSEMANAIVYVLEQESPLVYGEAARRAAEIMGYTRMGSNVIKVTDLALKYGVRNRKFRKTSNMYSL